MDTTPRTQSPVPAPPRSRVRGVAPTLAALATVAAVGVTALGSTTLATSSPGGAALGVVAPGRAVTVAAQHAAAATADRAVVGTAAATDAAEDTESTGDTESTESPAAAPLTRADVDAWLDDVLPAALEREGIPGAGVAVVHDGRVLTSRGVGLADVGSRTPVDPEGTLFRVGSVSKLATATAVMQLVERDEVDLDADVRTYLDLDLPLRFDEPVTLRHLLSHTAGFEERVRGLIRPAGGSVDLREALATDPPEQIYRPGTVPAYSNYGNALAGLVVEQVSGQRFEDYVAEHVLAPAGMTSSTFDQPLPADLAERLASGYDAPVADGGTAQPFETVGTPPAGSLTASTDDMARFMLAHLADDSPLLGAATMQEMHSPALDASSLGALAEGPRMTLGFFDRSRNGHRMIEHGGDTNVFHSDLELYPDDGTGVFVTMNGSGREGISSVRLRDDLLDGFADRYYPGAEPAGTGVDAATAREHAATLAGTYESSRTVRSNFLAAAYAVGQTSVTDRGDGTVEIAPAPDGSESAVFEEISPWVWRQVDGHRVVAARVEGGEVEAIGVDNAFALLPVAVERSQGVLLPVVGGSLGVLLLGSVGWLLAVLVGRVRRRGAAPEPRPGRGPRVLTRIGVAASVLAVAGWGVLLTQVMTLGDPSVLSIRAVQGLQLLGALAVLPAAARVVAEARERRWLRVASAGMVLAALVGIAWVAVGLRLLSPDVSY